MISEDMMKDLIQHARAQGQQQIAQVLQQQSLGMAAQAQQQLVNMQAQLNQLQALQPAPRLRLNQLGVLEVTEEAKDTHDEWRELNHKEGWGAPE